MKRMNPSLLYADENGAAIPESKSQFQNSEK